HRDRHSLIHSFMSPCDGVIMDYPVKTMCPNHLQDLLGDDSYVARFEGGEAMHIVLDVFDYHRFHAPCEGRVVEQKIIPGIHAGGGVIIWDESQGRYRYDSLGATGFQSLETRGVIILDTPDYGYIALVAVGIQQVSSVRWAKSLQSPITHHQSPIFLRAGKEIGRFEFGGSDIILLFEPGKAPAFELGKLVKVGDILA
ncbi:MAG: phosphatidylserine decarboxylase, partial [Paludibacteraceae bacterium]|nr:phosphatidylserine decarboxylase [Paludibacteraceae bacterium]